MMAFLPRWRPRLWTLALALMLYVIITAFVSLTRIQLAQLNGSSSSNNGSPQQDNSIHKAKRPRAPWESKSLAGMQPLALQQHLTPRRLRFRGASGATIRWCKTPLTLLDEPGPRVALASFPGSGNTWLRYLLQQATGVMTGSVYKDFTLMKNGFPGESITNGSVIAIKTHEFGAGAIAGFDRAILLIRDPFASLQAEFNRRSGGHIGHAAADKYRRDHGRIWSNYVKNQVVQWAKMNLAWFEALGKSGDDPAARDSDKKLLLMSYDDLVKDTKAQLCQALEFLLTRGKTESLDLACVMERVEGIYKRPKRPLGLELYDAELTKLLKEKMEMVYGAMGLQVPPLPTTSTMRTTKGTTTTSIGNFHNNTKGS